MDCSICYESFKEFEIVRGGCCSCLVCNKCILSLSDCPQCRKIYPWNKKCLNDLEWSRQNNQDLRNQIAFLYDVQLTFNQQEAKIDELRGQIKDAHNILLMKDIKINLLMNRIDVLTNNLENIEKNESNIIELEKVIQKYNLNIK
jgi:hypothetical protein